MKELHRLIQDVKVKKESELQQRNEMISHLKDQLQEMKAKSNMEGKYIKKCAEVAVAQTQKRCMLSEKELKDEIEVRCFCCCCCLVLFFCAENKAASTLGSALGLSVLKPRNAAWS